jgi:hypothetical protein
MSLAVQAVQVAQALAPAAVTVVQVASVAQQPNRSQTEMQPVEPEVLVAQQPVAVATAESPAPVAQR